MLVPFLLATVLASATQAVQINVDTSKAPDLQNFGNKVKATLSDWFPRVESILMSPTYKKVTQFNIFFDPAYKGVAEAYSGDNPPRIRGSVDYYRKNSDGVGSMVHEMAHIIQNYRKCDFWATEGIADWIRYYHFEPNAKPNKPSSQDSFRNGYGIAAYFLNYIESRYGGMIYYINKDCREGTYNENIFQRLTDLTADQHWANMLKSG